MLLGIAASAAVAPWIVPHDPLAVNIRHRLAPPAWMAGGGAQHLLGTDQVGRDLLSRVIYGGRVSLVVGVAAVLISATIGVLLGLGAGYFGRRTDTAIMTLVNVMLTFPFVLLALAVIAVLGPSLPNMILVLGAAGWPVYTRVVRAETLAIRERDFVVAGRALGMGHARIVFRQILPNLVSAITVIATLQVAQVIIAEAFLSFLGLGVQPPTPAWGNMLGEGRVYMLNSWWIAAFPGPRHLPHHARHQPHGERPARLARPAPQAVANAKPPADSTGRPVPAISILRIPATSRRTFENDPVHGWSALPL